MASHRHDDPRVQDAYSLRCAPHVLGAARDALAHTERAADAELSSAIDNPMILPDGRVMLNIRHEGKADQPGTNGATWRAVTASVDGTKGWEPVRLDKALAEPVCMAGLLRLDRGAGKSAA